MAAMISIGIIFFFFLRPTAASARGGGVPPVIVSTCAAVSKASLSTRYDDCIHMLSSSPSTASAADARGLAIAAANLTAVRVASTLAVLDNLMVALQYCVADYEEMQGSAVGAVDDLLHGADARNLDLLSKLKTSSFQPAFCDLAFMESNTDKDPMEAENLENEKLSRLAYGIAEVLRT
ncbi:uncharacterized protein LOC104583021 [Brachypodium distachyon]|uniref:Pectinesterase inhibitor domain-containing protein n=1 Tax=Brachypodium distachyon TaxID=15368 RepID=I1HC10_BRADI|nr:uncharacterized protein LOC104583021 [Brachypodium distachyon]KQK02712.1 hypothetical protein BRADI_2g03220v3 [Brachypodium distachyon]|eukprot:XP_010232969.1 uncharacterized protein LOC104583021 [Brachypodium distachyon]